MKKIKRISISVLILLLSLFVLQAFDFGPGKSDDNPNIDQMPASLKDYYSFHHPQSQQLTVVTTPDGYDNFKLGTDFAEVHMSTNPMNPSVFFNAYNDNDGYWSNDGYNFTYVTPPAPNTAGDPYTATDSLGNLYYITLNGSVSGTWVMKSTNFGQTWQTAVTGCVGIDRETISTDMTGGPYKGFVYCGETNGSGAACYRSTDGGATFQNVTTLTPHNLPGFLTAPGPGPTGISGGSVYAVTSYNLYYSPTYTFFRSTDGGATYVQMSQQNGWVNTVGTQSGGRNSVNNMRVRPYPFMYADNSFGAFRGRLYVFYCANNPAGNGNKPCVYIRYSTDGGTTFSNAIQINDDANPTASHHFQEQGYCDKTTGWLYCQWMDTRNTPTSDSAEIFGSYSTNGGVTWATNQRISNAKMIINCSTCPGGGTPRYQGDYSACSANGNISEFAWTDFRAGNFDSYFAYFPDFALRVNPSALTLNGSNDSGFVSVSVPSVKLYSYTSKFTATISPTPTSGTVTMTYLNRTTGVPLDSLVSYPDSLKLRVHTSGGVPSGPYTISITAKGTKGVPIHVRTVTLTVTPLGITSIGNSVPGKFYLYQNYPNPFNPSTEIVFDIAKAGNVKLTVYDISGRKVAELLNTAYNPGKYMEHFDASNYASGVYFYKLETPEYTSIRKMMLIK